MNPVIATTHGTCIPSLSAKTEAALCAYGCLVQDSAVFAPSPSVGCMVQKRNYSVKCPSEKK
jgi:hypothetical protein